MKQCPKCQIVKSLDSFSKNKSKHDGLNYTCKDCHKIEAKKWYNKNRTYHRKNINAWNKQNNQAIEEYIINYLRENGCVDCGNKNILVLEFDHIDEKIDSISSMKALGCSIKTIKKEIAKCEIRCANCHRIKTAKQFDWWRIKHTLVGNG